MATLEKLAVEREKLCRMDLNDPGILAQSRIVDELIVAVMKGGAYGQTHS